MKSQKISFEEVCKDENKPYTSMRETNVLCKLIKDAAGDVIEIGCNEGNTTQYLSIAAGKNKVFAIDYSGEEVSMSEEQKSEQISKDNLCHIAKSNSNVTSIDNRSDKINFFTKRFSNVRFAFIDGDHSKPVVKHDLEKMVDLISKNGGGIVACHDYYEGSPDWCAVKLVVDDFVKGNEKVEFSYAVEGTNIAVIMVNA